MITRSKKDFDVITDPEPKKIVPAIVGNGFHLETVTDDNPVKMGEELLSEVIKEPTLDRYLDRSPKLNTDQDYAEMVKLLQSKRAAFITAEQKKREPKIEGEEDNGTL